MKHKHCEYNQYFDAWGRLVWCYTLAGAATLNPQSRAWGQPTAVKNGLDVVAVRIDHERRVVVRVVLRAQARCAVVTRPGGQCRRMKRHHLGFAGGAKRDVASGGKGLRLGNLEGASRVIAGRKILGAKPDRRFQVKQHSIAQRGQHWHIKTPAHRNVGDMDTGVIDHLNYLL